jgi:PIN domain nuclease of toxin-antitoxin system
VRLLLDTNILLPMVDGRGRTLPTGIITVISDPGVSLFASVASIWEVAIKHRMGKLVLPCPLELWPAALTNLNITTLTIRTAHAIRDIEVWPETNDPFDRLLLATCDAEMMQLVTRDRKLQNHPLAWRA